MVCGDTTEEEPEAMSWAVLESGESSLACGVWRVLGIAFTDPALVGSSAPMHINAFE